MSKIAVVVCNPCAPDYRVNKQAEFMASRGHHVRVFCRTKEGLPNHEIVHGVEYVRYDFHIISATKKLLKGGIKTTSSNMNNPLSVSDRIKNMLLRFLLLLLKIIAFVFYVIPIKIFKFVSKAISYITKAISYITKTITKIITKIRKKLLSFPQKIFRKIVNRFSKAIIHHAFAATYSPHLAAWAPDVIHAHDLTALPAAVKAASNSDTKIIYDAHELETHRNPPPPPVVKAAISWTEKRYIKKADEVITVCEPIADYLGNLYGIKKPHVVMNTPIYPFSEKRNGTFLFEDTIIKNPDNHWHAAKKSNKDLRKTAGVPKDKKIAIYVGLVTVNRGIETVIEALPQLPDVYLVTVGPTNPATVEMLIEMANELGVGDRFILLPPEPATHVVDFVTGADFGVCPIWPITKSYDWALPNKLFEMTFAGLPIVASNTQEVSRFLNSNDLGLIYKFDDANDCAHKIQTLLDNFSDYEITEQKKLQLQKNYSWQKQTKIVADIYDRVLPN